MNRRNERFAVVRAQFAICLLLSLLLNLVSPAYLLSRTPEVETPVSYAADAAEVLGNSGTMDYFIYLPLVTKPLPPSPGDGLIVSWAQVEEGGSRNVLLHWRTPPDATIALASPMFASAMNSYAIDRRVAGDTAWQTVGQTGFASNAAEMEAILGADLVKQLGYDLSGDPMGTPLTAQEIYDLLKSDPALAQVLSQAYYQVGLVTGTSYFDRDAPGGTTLEYQVRDLGPGGNRFEPASVPPKGPDIHPPFKLRETWEGPDGLGQAPSSRPDDAPERYSWQTTSDYRPWDGKVYLIWDTPDEGKSNDGRVEDARQAMNISGYRVYRSEHGLNRWSSINPTKARCATLALCEMLVGVAPEPSESAFPIHYFMDDLHHSSPDPGKIYDIWDYKVCAVDALGSDAECSTVLTVDVRELQPPIAVQGIASSVPEDQSKVTITWTYSDTLELSPPLRFYVTRSPTLTAPMDEWTVVKDKTNPVDYIEVPSTIRIRRSVTDFPPRDQIFWYRVQVRDDAGNWSAEGIAVKAARYTRTPPNLPPISYDRTACERNPMPLRLRGLDDNVFIVNLYRSFDEGGPFQLIERFEVTQTPSQNYVDISDDFLPAYPTYAYYRLEAVDDHGNVSSQESYCAQLGDGPVMDPGLPIVTSDVTCNPEQGCTFTASVGGSTAGKMPVGIEIMQPGEQGVPVTATTTMTDTYEIDVNDGTWVNLRSWLVDGDTISDTITTWEHVLVNEFLDTDRELQGLGPVVSAQWMTDTHTAPHEHYVRINIVSDDSPTPPLAIFRRPEHGNWIQVSPVSVLPHHYFEDRSDPSPGERYEYLVLVLSPTSYEMLGYWEPITVEPLIDAPPTAKITGGISWPDPINPACDQSPEPGPNTIYLANGWWIKNPSYWVADDGDLDCPDNSRTSGVDSDHAYGSGTLTNGAEEWPGVEFHDIAYDGRTLQHTGGRIVAMLDETLFPTGGFKYSVRDVEFTAGDVKAEVEVTLPETIKVEIDGFDRTDTLFGVFPQLTTNYGFDPMALGSGVLVIDESLPWQLHTDEATLDEATLDLGASVRTSFRIADGGSTSRPDNNLGFLRPSYESVDAVVTSDGLIGGFATGEGIDYATSFPAGFVVSSDGGTVKIEDSQIKEGELWKAQASLTYDARRTVTDYVADNRQCNTRPRSRYSLCQGFLGTVMPEARTLVMTPDPAGGPIPIGLNGYLSATVTMDQETTWPSFSTDPPHGTLFIAPAAFPDEPTSWAPMPAEAAWQRLPDRKTGGTFDPGLNLNSEDETINYTFYDPPEFEGSAMNLYVRRGGVSGHIIMTDEGPRTNQWGYSENVQRIELVFLDNAILAPPEEFVTDLTLPYPTDATLPLNVEHFDGANRPLDGGFRKGDVEVTHRYWSFTETPSRWVYAPAKTTDYTDRILGVLPKIFQLQDCTASIPGLQPASADPDTAPVELVFNTEWLPDGDIGALRPLQPVGVSYRTGSFKFSLSAIKLSRYYSGILDDASDPSTLGIDLDDTMDTLPEEIMDSGGNLTGASLANCAATTVDGCGLIVLDGDIAVDYFGEVKGPEETRAQAIEANIPAVDELVGEFPMAVNYAILGLKFVGIQSGRVPWVWPVLNGVLDAYLPVKFLGNTEGGILVALKRNASLFPGTEIFEADTAGIIDIRWEFGTYNDMVGIYLGYGASQAAFRALAMNRPMLSGDIRPYDQWSQVSSDIAIWADKFGYSRPGGAQNDPVDLAEEIWEEGWCTEMSGSTCPEANRRPYNEVFEVLEPVLKSMDGDDAYGVTGVEAGSALRQSNISMNTTALSAVFRYTGIGLEIIQLEGGGQMQWDIWDYSLEYEDIEFVDIDFFLRANWLRFEMDRDGEIEVFGDTYANLIYDWGVDAYLHALATPVGDEWRFEGVVDAEPIGIAGLSALELDGTYGAGPYLVPGTSRIEYISYFGGNFEAYFLDYRVGGGFLYGVVPQESAILREAGFGEIMDTLGDQGSYAGIYAYLFGDFPIAGDSCLLKASAGGEIRFWYFWSDGIWGGTLTGFVHATAACVISARGQLELGYARLDSGGTMYNRTCESSKCDIYGGSFWIATGVGWCSPSSWHRWHDRWWGDSWCYTFGAYVDLTYMDPGGLDYSYDLDYE
jgi:hypothetical protein